MAGWHHQCNSHELGQTLGYGEGQESLSCCSALGQKEPDTTEQLSLPVVMYGCESWTMKRLSAEELMLLNCGVGEDS